jgi:hypothetical protein
VVVLQAERDGLAALSDLLFGPRDTSDILVRDRVVAVTERTLITPARSVAERGDDLGGHVELGDQARKPGYPPSGRGPCTSYQPKPLAGPIRPLALWIR